MVARTRGVKFGSLGGDIPDDRAAAISDLGGVTVAYRAFGEVASWLGFEDSEDYSIALERERERIFERATY